MQKQGLRLYKRVHSREIKRQMETVKVVGGGLAGCEAAYQIARHGLKVELYDMKPEKHSPVHISPDLCELVCSNSLRSADVTNACGLLKEEMRVFSSLIMKAADKTAVPAGSALAVDRNLFSSYVTKALEENENVTIIRREITKIPDGPVVLAPGPLASEDISKEISDLIGSDSLHFYDAVAPIISADSIDYGKAYFASRYGKGNPTDYLNCPMNKEEYSAFYNALVTAKTADLHEPDKKVKVFEGCMPVEIMAARGPDTLCFGPLKPVGLERDGYEKPYAVVQLRRENTEGESFNIVGFQTHLTFPEQKRVFSMIPGLENAEFLRYGVMHRNTYIESPGKISPCYSLKKDPRIFFAGQITGVEGYVESAASGIIAGINAARFVLGKEPLVFPAETMIGAMANYVSGYPGPAFQPMNANYGILPPLSPVPKGGKKIRYAAMSERALKAIKEFNQNNNTVEVKL